MIAYFQPITGSDSDTPPQKSINSGADGRFRSIVNWDLNWQELVMRVLFLLVSLIFTLKLHNFSNDLTMIISEQCRLVWDFLFRPRIMFYPIFLVFCVLKSSLSPKMRNSVTECWLTLNARETSFYLNAMPMRNYLLYWMLIDAKRPRN